MGDASCNTIRKENLQSVRIISLHLHFLIVNTVEFKGSNKVFDENGKNTVANTKKQEMP